MRRLLALATVLLVAALTGCSSTADKPAESASEQSSSLSGELTVFAAASLKDTFTELASEFEKQNPDVDVLLSFAGSSDLAAQIAAGAPADVFASADEANMDKVADQAANREDFATNVLEIVVPKGNPAGISSFADLGTSKNVVICAEQVPCGAATKKVEDATGTTIKPVSEESSVTDVLGKVASGQADAGLVYVTDVAANDSVDGVSFPESSAAVNTYPIATVSDNEAATAFLELVHGEAGQKVLADAGFGTP